MTSEGPLNPSSGGPQQAASQPVVPRMDAAMETPQDAVLGPLDVERLTGRAPMTLEQLLAAR